MGIVKLLRLDKPIGILLLLWPTLIGLWFAAGGLPDLFVLFVFASGVVVMRSAGCVLNDIADRDFDRHVARTKHRPLAQKLIPLPVAWFVLFALLIIALLLAWQLNNTTRYFAVVGLVLAGIYPFMKRITNFPQIILGLAFAWSIPMAYTALNKPLAFTTLFLFLAMAVWIIAYDTEYAMIDREDDRKIGVKSTAIAFGNKDRIFIGLCHSLCVLIMLGLGVAFDLNKWFFAALLIASALAGYQQYLIKDRLPKKCFQAFLQNNYFGMALFFGTCLGFYF